MFSKTKTINGILLIFCFLVLIIKSNALDAKTNFDHTKRHIFKFTIAELSRINLSSYKVGYEYLLKNGKNAIETELGYTHYSREDSVSTNGFYSSLFLNQNIGKRTNERFVLKAMFFYQGIKMNSYLMYEDSMPGVGPYYKFKKTNYIKTRSGITLILSYQRALFKSLFFELNSGFGIIHFKTNKIPNEVVQENFVNGIYNRQREFWAPNVILNIKLGFML